MLVSKKIRDIKLAVKFVSVCALIAVIMGTIERGCHNAH